MVLLLSMRGVVLSAPKLAGAECGKINRGDGEIELDAGRGAVLGGDAQSVIDDHFGGALNVALVLEPLTVAHPRAEMENKTTTRESGIIAEELTNNCDSGAPMGIAHLVEFFLDAHNESNLSAGFGATPSTE